ncbi:hypothetical protein [Lysinibacillus parviboronicapiens]|uniref:hypothetical protein n=1 Tax=Lysinibacillus parviboronicapiens TaxID=436516 RepID=UPI00187D5EBE|nr:hypothetical protein [Lysinibacillus parviboronicapiens]
MMKRQYALVSVVGISEDKFQEYLAEFINKMSQENKSNFGATVFGLDEKYGREIEESN